MNISCFDDCTRPARKRQFASAPNYLVYYKYCWSVAFCRANNPTLFMISSFSWGILNFGSQENPTATSFTTRLLAWWISLKYYSLDVKPQLINQSITTDAVSDHAISDPLFSKLCTLLQMWKFYQLW